LALPYRWQWRVEKWKSAWRSFFGGDKQPRPKLCPACGSLVGVNATRCHQCGASLRFSLAAISKGLSGIFGGTAPVTTVLLVVNILIFGVSLVTTMQSGQAAGLSILWGLAPDRLTLSGATNPFAIYYAHQWYRLITAMFLHGSLIHIGFNMMVLMDIGPAVEDVYGSARYLFLYISTGVAGFLLSSLSGHSSIGASGAILGLIGLMIAITTKRGGSFMRELRSRLISWVVVIFVLGFMLGGLRTDNWAHFGGVAAGFGLGKLFVDRQPMNGAEQKRAYLLGWLAGIAVLASFAFMLLHFRDALPRG
jgi:rhomboid protease GluP